VTPTVLPRQIRDRARKSALPDWIDPMLATLTEKYFSDPNWIFERKLDGERVLAFLRGKKVRLYSRNRILLNGNYPELVVAFEQSATIDFVVDGEVVAFDGKVTSFAKLQSRMQTRDPEAARRSGVRICYYLFDIPWADGYDLTGLALRDRKRLLRDAVRFEDPLRFTVHRVGEGEAFREEACRKGWEGVIAKRAASPYASGRSKDWLKFKCVNEQEFVIVGFTNPAGSRTAFGSLLVGYHENGELRYAGKVGTGYSQEVLRELGDQLRKIEVDSLLFAERVKEKGAHWVKPKFVAQIAFTEWTRDGKLRHPRFRGLRRDKKPRDVVRERPS
jgi:DNA ligase D-like protein (predicted ligase)